MAKHDKQAPRMGQREILMCSDLQFGWSVETMRTATIRASEAGWADLSRLLVMANDADAVLGQGSQNDLIPRLLGESIAFGNLGNLVRGGGGSTGARGAPGGVFSPLRTYSAVQLGLRRMRSRETLALGARVVQPIGAPPDIINADLCIAVPYLADRLSADGGIQIDPAMDHTDLASDAFSGDFGVPITLELIADEAGILDLNSLQILAGLTTLTADYSQDASTAFVVRRITLPSGEQLVTGATVPPTPGMPAPPVAAPGAIFTHVGRANTWVRFGQIVVDEGDTVQIEVESRANFAGPPPTMTFSAGARFYVDAKWGG